MHYSLLWPFKELSYGSPKQKEMKAPSGKLLCIWYTYYKKNYAAHAWQNSIQVLLLGRSGCSSPYSKELHSLTILELALVQLLMRELLLVLHADGRAELELDGVQNIFLNGPFLASFSLFSSFQYTVDSKQIYVIFADDWIRTADLWYHKWPLYQLTHNHCPRTTFIAA